MLAPSRILDAHAVKGRTWPASPLQGWDNLGTSWRQFCFPQLTTDLSRDPGDVRLGRVHDRQRVLGGRDRAGLGDRCAKPGSFRSCPPLI